MQSTHTSWCPFYRRRWSAGTSPGSRAVHSSPCPKFCALESVDLFKIVRGHKQRMYAFEAFQVLSMH